MRLSEFRGRLDDRLRVADFAAVDASPNGLQVGPPDGEVAHAAFAVDAAVETAERAAEAGADVLVTHHGLIWGGLERVTGRAYRRIAPLIDGDVGLYVAHLPLDAHPELGNAAGVADVLGLEDRKPFAHVEGEAIGRRGSPSEPFSAGSLRDRLTEKLDTGDGGVRTLDFGPDEIRDVAVVTGSGADFLDEAVEAGADALVTGEGKGKTYHEAREAGITVVLAGHYATETFGVRSLAALVDGWGIETTFIDHPTGL